MRRESNGANNTLEHDALWISMSMLRTVCSMSESRENDESILNSDTGISFDSAHSFTLVFVTKPSLLIIPSQCHSYKMYIF